MRHTKTTRYALLLAFALLAPVFFSSITPVHGATSFFLTPVPAFTQEGLTITLVLTVVGALPITSYQFSFVVKDPSGKNWTSTLQTHNTTATESQFSILLIYPSTSFAGKNSLVGQYNAQVNQVKPVTLTNVASTPFYILLTNLIEYQRTDTVNIRASGYNGTESTTVTIRTQTSSTLVFSRTILASPTGVVTANWKIPKNATIDNYLVTITGTSTVKTPPDLQGFAVKVASMSIASLSSVKSSYQRTDSMHFSFAPVYPDGTPATTGVALLTLRSPSNVNVTMTATYNATSHVFEAKYPTSITNVTGTWTALLAASAYGDGFGNTGPVAGLSNAPQLTIATLGINILVNSYFSIGQQVKFNASITYPDGAIFRSGTAGAYLVYSGTPAVTNTIPILFDTTLNLWVGSYTPQSTDPGGLWTLKVNATDPSIPPNTGSATRIITLQDRPPVATFSVTPTLTQTGRDVDFDATGSYDPDGQVVTYIWNFGDGTTGSGIRVTHIYNTVQGTQQVYTVSLVVTDNSGSTGSFFSTVTITDRPPVVSFTKSANITIVSQSLLISITSSDPDGTISTTKINWGDGITDTLAGPQTTASHTYTSAGSTGTIGYSIVVTVMDNSGLTTSQSSTITVQATSTGGSPSGSLSVPLFYFGIIAAIVAALLIGGFLAFRRHKVTHTKLKIDLEAVKSEAGRIENQEFFQSVKDQLKKDKGQ